jgi:hypothetical protein
VEEGNVPWRQNVDAKVVSRKTALACDVMFFHAEPQA